MHRSRYAPFRRPGSRAVPLRSGLAVLAGLAACGACGLTAGPAQAAAAGPPAAPAAGTLYGSLDSVSADSPSDAWAVGSYGSGVSYPTLIEHWNGKSWAKVPSPSPGIKGQDTLNAVSAQSPKDVWAVGAYSATSGGTVNSLILHWNGTSWKQVPSPNPGASSGATGLNAVHAISASDAWAVGDYEVPGSGSPTVPLILHWNGTSWKQVTSPSPGGTTGVTYLNGVSAVSAKDVWAAGFSTPTINGPIRSVTLRWNGTSWKQVASPNPGGTNGNTYLEGVSAVSASSAWAVGFDATPRGNNRPLTLHWNGTSWKQVASPNPGGTTGTTNLYGVSAQSSTNAWAVGSTTSGGTLILHWNGTSWTRVTSPN